MHTCIQLKVFGCKWGHFSKNWYKSLQVNEFDEILHFAVRNIKLSHGLAILYSKDFKIIVRVLTFKLTNANIFHLLTKKFHGEHRCEGKNAFSHLYFYKVGSRTLNTRCGRVMADNIAYAKFRKNLLI